MCKIGVVAAIYLSNNEHLDMAMMTLESLSATDNRLDRIAVVNKIQNGLVQPEFFKRNFDCILYNDENIVARAWNKGIAEAFRRGNDYALVINLDMIFRWDTIDNLVAEAVAHPEPIIWSGTAWPDPESLGEAELKYESIDDAHFSCFFVDRRLFADVGQFDEGFKPAYHEDADMRRRIRLQGKKMMMTKRALFFHIENGVIKGSGDSRTADFWEIDQALGKCLARYIRKWGGHPYHETYKEPFNGEIEREE